MSIDSPNYVFLIQQTKWHKNCCNMYIQKNNTVLTYNHLSIWYGVRNYLSPSANFPATPGSVFRNLYIITYNIVTCDKMQCVQICLQHCQMFFII
jgi:sulfur relay (sulfurtransferase) DsrC/TusE family protein